MPARVELKVKTITLSSEQRKTGGGLGIAATGRWNALDTAKVIGKLAELQPFLPQEYVSPMTRRYLVQPFTAVKTLSGSHYVGVPGDVL